jgi:hypothetical protein
MSDTVTVLKRRLVHFFLPFMPRRNASPSEEDDSQEVSDSPPPSKKRKNSSAAAETRVPRKRTASGKQTALGKLMKFELIFCLRVLFSSIQMKMLLRPT